MAISWGDIYVRSFLFAINNKKCVLWYVRIICVVRFIIIYNLIVSRPIWIPNFVIACILSWLAVFSLFSKIFYMIFISLRSFEKIISSTMIKTINSTGNFFISVSFEGIWI